MRLIIMITIIILIIIIIIIIIMKTMIKTKSNWIFMTRLTLQITKFTKALSVKFTKLAFYFMQWHIDICGIKRKKKRYLYSTMKISLEWY